MEHKTVDQKRHLRAGSEPLASEPAVEELQGRLGLVHGDHVATSIDTHESKVTVGLELADLLALVLVVHDLDILQGSRRELRLSRPFKGLSPRLVAKPVANEVSITSIDQDGDLLEDIRDDAVVWLHPVTVEEEVTVDVEVAGIVAVNLGTNSLQNLRLVEVLGDVAETLVAKVAVVLALAANVINVLSSALVRTQQGVVAVDRSGHTGPCTLSVVAGLDHRLAAGQSIVHRAASALVKNRGVASLTAGHGAVVAVLGKAIGQTVANQNRLEVDVAVLVREDLRGENWDVMASVGLSSDVEVLLSILGELLEEKRKQSIDILAGRDGVTDRRAAV